MTTLKIASEIKEIFPYEKIRPIQDELIHTIHSSLKERKNVIIEGANGLGKTVATLTACLPIAREHELQVVHVCRTNKQADRVIAELKEIAKQTSVSGISIRGRRDMCPHPLIKKHGTDAATASVLCGQLKKLKKCEFCNRLAGSLPYLNSTIKALKAVPSSSGDILQACEEHRICPYELIRQLIEEVDVVAASYQYIFNPPIREIFMNRVARGMNEILLIVDECHNIIDASLDISSDQLSIFSIRQAAKEIKAFGNHEFIRLIRTLQGFLERNQQRTEEEQQIDPRKLVSELSRETNRTIDLDFAAKIIRAGEKNQKRYLAQNKSPRSYLHRIGQFLQKWVVTKNRAEFLHLITNYRTRSGGWGVKFEIVSLDARYTTQNVFDFVHNSIHISGTIEPIEAYAKIVGMNSLPLTTKVLDSPYSERNVRGFVIKNVSTRYNERTPENYKKMCQIIAEVANNSPANTGVFTASYGVMSGLLNAGIEFLIEKPLFQEKSQMSSRANDRLVNEFKRHATKGGAVLLGVLGGRSSEGADFPGGQMNTCIIVGVPYARPTTRIEAQIQYLDEQFKKKGREYGYIIPAIRRAAQAAGRPVRSINDHGLIIFLDNRFSHSYTARFLPQWLKQNTRPLDYQEGMLAYLVQEFFQEV
ncbi:MAG: hypothetical protein GF308_16465 [Candidatus Heimdallarchaeota archaeon]|nr:hypothetical protein [Candidatus Heimdallarchaeota archaeon]